MSGMQSDSRKTARRSSRVAGWVGRREDGGLVFSPRPFSKGVNKKSDKYLQGVQENGNSVGGGDRGRGN